MPLNMGNLGAVPFYLWPNDCTKVMQEEVKNARSSEGAYIIIAIKTISWTVKYGSNVLNTVKVQISGFVCSGFSPNMQTSI